MGLIEQKSIGFARKGNWPRAAMAMAILLLVASGFLFWRRSSSVEHELDRLVRAYAKSDANSAEGRAIEESVRRLGPAAIPTLLEWLGRQSTPFDIAGDRLLRQFLPARTLILSVEERRILASLCFKILGTNAASAAPQLVNLIRCDCDWDTIAISLFSGGTNGLPLLTNLCARGDACQRIAALKVLGEFVFICGLPVAETPAYVELQNSILVPTLLGALADPDPAIRLQATISLCLLKKSHVEEIVPILARLLNDDSPNIRSEAAYRLGRFGGKSLPASKKLQDLLVDPDAAVRKQATNALAQITKGLSN